MASENSALAQAIVAHQGFISALSSSIFEHIRPELWKSLHSSSSAEVPMGQKAFSRTEVPLGQKVPSSAVPVGQAERTNKRSLPAGPFVIEEDDPSKRAGAHDLLAPSCSEDGEVE